MDMITRKRLDFYRKWLQALLVKEFLNLPLKLQAQFISLVEKFLADCRRVHTEAETIAEKEVKIEITEIREHSTDMFLVTGRVEGSDRWSPLATRAEVKILVPVTAGLAVGSSIPWTVFSTDKETWYSNKEELILGRAR